MKFDCPRCGTKGEFSVDAVRPMQAIAAEMLERDVIFRCPSCHIWHPGVYDITCPECGKKTLTSAIEEDPNHIGITKNWKGEINCTNCTFNYEVN